MEISKLSGAERRVVQWFRLDANEDGHIDLADAPRAEAVLANAAVDAATKRIVASVLSKGTGAALAPPAPSTFPAFRRAGPLEGWSGRADAVAIAAAKAHFEAQLAVGESNHQWVGSIGGVVYADPSAVAERTERWSSQAQASFQSRLEAQRTAGLDAWAPHFPARTYPMVDVVEHSLFGRLDTLSIIQHEPPLASSLVHMLMADTGEPLVSLRVDHASRTVTVVPADEPVRVASDATWVVPHGTWATSSACWAVEDGHASTVPECEGAAVATLLTNGTIHPDLTVVNALVGQHALGLRRYDVARDAFRGALVEETFIAGETAETFGHVTRMGDRRQLAVEFSMLGLAKASLGLGDHQEAVKWSSVLLGGFGRSPYATEALVVRGDAQRLSGNRELSELDYRAALQRLNPEATEDQGLVARARAGLALL